MRQPRVMQEPDCSCCPARRFSILNSLMVVVVMSSIVAMIMMRTIRRDLARYEGLLGEPGTQRGQFRLPACLPHGAAVGSCPAGL